MTSISISSSISSSIKGAMHRHSPRRGVFEALFFTSAVLVASSSYIQL